MVKVLSTPPPIPKERIPREGIEVMLENVKIVRDQWTSIGTMELGLGGTIELDGEDYSWLFSLKGDPITGSIGRLLVAAGIEDFKKDEVEAIAEKLNGLKVKVANRGGKLYWYP